MTDTATWTLHLRVEGIALWMHRGTHLDVLFPDDTFARDDGRHHYVTVHEEGALQQAQGAAFPQAMLDFTALPFAEYTGPVTPVGGVPLTIEPGALATRPDAVRDGTGLIGGLRLPLGALSALNQPVGPFMLDGRELYLSYGMGWSGTLQGTQSLEVPCVAHGTGAMSTLTLPGGAASADRTVLIRCLSRNDRADFEKIQGGDYLSEVAYYGYLATTAREPLRTVPQFLPQQVIEASPRKPCSAAYPDPFI